MPTAIYGVLTFLIVLGPLVILHELGHFFAARLSGVKIVEFGFGFPPRAWGLWTGRTHVRIDRETQVEMARATDLRAAAPVAGSAHPPGASIIPGDMVAIATERAPDGTLTARRIVDQRERDSVAGQGNIVAGKVREVGAEAITISEMVWSFNLLPLGGFVKMVGEEDPSAEGSLAGKSRLARAFVLASGSGVNAILPFVIFAIVAMIPQNILVGKVAVSAVMPDSPAERAGLREGDIVVRVDGRDIENIAALQSAVTLRLGALSTWEVRRAIPDPAPAPGGPRYQYRPGVEKVQLVPRWRPPARQIVRGVTDPKTQIELWQARRVDPFAGVSSSLTVVNDARDTAREISLADARRIAGGVQLGDRLRVVPEVTDPRSQISFADARAHDSALGLTARLQEGAVGITIANTAAALERQWVPPWTAVGRGFHQVQDLLILTRNGITSVIVGSGNPQLEGPATIGPIGIGQLTGEIATSGADLVAKITTLASLAATLSLSLAVINILPIPALDGGRLLFVVIEFVRRGKRIPPEREGLVHLAGMAVLLTLIALISVQDILRIIRGESFF